MFELSDKNAFLLLTGGDIYDLMGGMRKQYSAKTWRRIAMKLFVITKHRGLSPLAILTLDELDILEKENKVFKA